MPSQSRSYTHARHVCTGIITDSVLRVFEGFSQTVGKFALLGCRVNALSIGPLLKLRADKKKTLAADDEKDDDNNRNLRCTPTNHPLRGVGAQRFNSCKSNECRSVISSRRYS